MRHARSGISRRLLAVTPVVGAAISFYGILGAAFYADDLEHFISVADGGTLRFVTTPYAGHVKLAVHAVVAASWHAFGLDTRPYFACVLGTHLLNVWLLTRLAQRLGAGSAASALIALWWGASGMHTDTLTWYPVYGQVLGTSLMLLVLWDAARFTAAADGVLAVRRVLAWGAALLVGGTCFGTGLAAAAVVPLAIVALVPSVRRPACLVALAAIPFAMGGLYLTAIAVSRRTGTAPVTGAMMMAVRSTGFGPVPGMLAHLIRFGVFHLVGGRFVQGIDPIGPSWIVLAIVVIGFACARDPRGAGSAARVLALVAVGVYGAVALGRAGLSRLWGLDQVLLGETLRYHYAGSAPLAVALALLLGSTTHGHPVLRRVVGLLVVVELGWIVASPLRLDLHEGARAALNAQLAAVAPRIAEAVAEAPLRLPNTRLPAALVGPPLVVQPGWPNDVPGLAGLLILAYPPARLEDRGIRLIEPSTAIREHFTAPHSQRLSRLLIGPLPSPARPDGGGSCEFDLSNEVERFIERLLGGTLQRRGTAWRGIELERATARVDAMGTCRPCLDLAPFFSDVAGLVTNYADTWVLHCGLPERERTDAPCEKQRVHAAIKLFRTLLGCRERGMRVGDALDERACVDASEERYRRTLAGLPTACGACENPIVPMVAHHLTALAMEKIFCVEGIGPPAGRGGEVRQ